MAKTVKQHGRVYTPDYLVKVILDFGGYDKPNILNKHVIDNSCGDGAFLKEVVKRYCSTFLEQSDDLFKLKHDLEKYIHGIELDTRECEACIHNLNEIATGFGLSGIHWDIINGDTLTICKYNEKMDFVFGNPPYVRVHNLENSYDAVKKFKFAEGGMTDLFIVFFEIGFKMLTKVGLMCLITPSSWLSSLAGRYLRQFIHTHQFLSGVIDLEHFQPFQATTYTFISRFSKSNKIDHIDYYTFDGDNRKAIFQDKLSYSDIQIGKNFYFSKTDRLALLKNIKTTYSYPYVSVKNGFATLADKVFIGDFDFTEGTIDILKASSGKWSKCIYPYDKNGKPLLLKDFMNNTKAYNHLLSNKDKLSKSRDIEDDKFWYLFGRTQALKDVSKSKYAINTLIRDLDSIKLECVPQGSGIYSGLYILTDIEFETIKQLVFSKDFITYIKLLKNYKSGGYYTFASKDLEQYLNYKLTEKHGQSRISNGSRELF